jgi:8-oxo-dGTP diphosphatase
VLCTHRPVLAKVFDALGLKNPRLELGEMLILHLRRGTAVASERQLVR